MRDGADKTSGPTTRGYGYAILWQMGSENETALGQSLGP